MKQQEKPPWKTTETPQPLTLHELVECGMLIKDRPTYWQLYDFKGRQACGGGFKFCCDIAKKSGLLKDET